MKLYYFNPPPYVGQTRDGTKLSGWFYKKVGAFSLQSNNFGGAWKNFWWAIISYLQRRG